MDLYRRWFSRTDLQRRCPSIERREESAAQTGRKSGADRDAGKVEEEEELERCEDDAGEEPNAMREFFPTKMTTTTAEDKRHRKMKTYRWRKSIS